MNLINLENHQEKTFRGFGGFWGLAAENLIKMNQYNVSCCFSLGFLTDTWPHDDAAAPVCDGALALLASQRHHGIIRINEGGKRHFSTAAQMFLPQPGESRPS